MSFIVYKKFGRQEYAYEVKSYWDSKKKSPRQKTKYLGVVVDKKKGLFERRNLSLKTEKLILDFGDSFILNRFFQDIGFADLIGNVFGSEKDFLLALLTYRLCYPSAMIYSKTWFEGNYAKMLFPEVNFSSQRISEFFEVIGDENLQRKFFKEYIVKYTNAKKGIIIDASSLPNQVHMPLTQWGRSGEDIDKQIRFLLVIDKEKSLPLFFRYFPGNIVDVSTLNGTIAELQKYGLKKTFVYLDAGYFSKDNLTALMNNQIDFLIRLPANRTLYKSLIEEEAKNLESADNITLYGKRGLFIKQKKVDLFGKKVFAYLVLDPKRKGREINKLLLQTVDEKNSNKELPYLLSKKGTMILISSLKLEKQEVVPAYYIRQTAEKMFGFSKDDLKILPVRVHKEETFRGFLFMQFLSLIAFVQLKETLGKKHTVEKTLLTFRNLKCKVYDKEILIGELSKQQKELSELLKILVPKKSGI